MEHNKINAQRKSTELNYNVKKKKASLQINDVSFCLKKLETKEQIKPKEIRKEEIVEPK